MVFEATYLVAVLTPGHASACCGQYGAQMSKVLRPNNRSNGMFICFLRAVPRISSEYGTDPPAIREAAAGIFVWPAWGLYDTIKGDMFKHNNFSHGNSPLRDCRTYILFRQDRNKLNFEPAEASQRCGLVAGGRAEESPPKRKKPKATKRLKKMLRVPTRLLHAMSGGSSLPCSITEENHTIAKAAFLQKLELQSHVVRQG